MIWFDLGLGGNEQGFRSDEFFCFEMQNNNKMCTQKKRK